MGRKTKGMVWGKFSSELRFAARLCTDEKFSILVSTENSLSKRKLRALTLNGIVMLDRNPDTYFLGEASRKQLLKLSQLRFVKRIELLLQRDLT